MDFLFPVKENMGSGTFAATFGQHRFQKQELGIATRQQYTIPQRKGRSTATQAPTAQATQSTM